MSTQDAWTACLLIPSVIFGIVAWRAKRSGRTTLGLDPRAGALAEFGRGCLFSVPFFAALLLVFWATGLIEVERWQAVSGEVVVIWVYFLVLFLLEEIVFRSLFMTGLGVATTQAISLAVVAVLTAAAYVFADHSGFLPVLGAIVTNVLTGIARWRSGRIWWGLGQRWVWNSLSITFGFYASAFSIDDPVLVQKLSGPDWLTGGQFGQEGGVVGIIFQILLIAGALRLARGRQGPWRIDAQERHRPRNP